MPTRPLEAVLRHIRKLADGQAVAELTDAQLVRSFAAGNDQVAFAALVERHGRLVFNVCRNILHHQQDAEDAFQVTFLVLAKSAASIRHTERIVGWLHGVAYRSAMQIKREAARRLRHERRVTGNYLSPLGPRLTRHWSPSKRFSRPIACRTKLQEPNSKD